MTLQASVPPKLFCIILKIRKLKNSLVFNSTMFAETGALALAETGARALALAETENLLVIVSKLSIGVT